MRLWTTVAAICLICRLDGAQAQTSDRDRPPLVLASQGSFFVGGETRPVPSGPAIQEPANNVGELTRRLSAGGNVTVNQMYVQYQVPLSGDQHPPLVMVHGCCLTSKTWETTPDGRMGWSEYFVRKDRSVYLADQVSRGRSGFDASALIAAKATGGTTADVPTVTMASHEVAWTLFRFGPRAGTAFPDSQFPIEAVDELYKQMVPDLNSMLPTSNPTWNNVATLAARLRGAVIIGHSQAGVFPQRAALIDPASVKGMITIETTCPQFSPEQIATLAKIPTLVMFGDHLDDNFQNSPATWPASFVGCQRLIDQLKAAGGDAEMLHLPKLGIKGNSHMLMQDKNNLQLADLILAWIDTHVKR